MADPNNNWKVGDFCRAVFTEDNNEYEAKILSVETCPETDQQYVEVEYIGYMNKEVHWVSELMESKGTAARKQQNREAHPGEADMPNGATLWKVGDPIRAVYSEDNMEYEGNIIAINGDQAKVKFLGYGNEQDVAVNLLMDSLGEKARKAQEAQAAQDEGDGTASPSWKVGDLCRGEWDEDKNEYEGQISAIYDTEGKNQEKYAEVIFLGYGNTGTIWVSQLLPSKGKAARIKQCSDAGVGPIPQDQEGGDQVDSAPKFNIGDSCRGVWSEDQNEYEATISSIDKADDGQLVANVTFIGYGNEDRIYVSQLLASHGPDARNQQLAEAKAVEEEAQQQAAEEEAKKKAAEENSNKKAHDAKSKAEQEAKRKVEAEAKAKAEKDAKAKVEKEAKAKAENEAKAKAEKEAKAKAEMEVKRKAEAEAKAKTDAKAKLQVENEALKAENELLKTAIDSMKKANVALVKENNEFKSNMNQHDDVAVSNMKVANEQIQSLKEELAAMADSKVNETKELLTKVSIKPKI